MEIIYEIRGDILVAELYGEMDHHASEKIRNDIDGMMEMYGLNKLIFDFGRVTFMDSAGIGIVLGRYRRLQERGGAVAIAACMPKVRSILEMAGVLTVIKYGATKEKAAEILLGNDSNAGACTAGSRRAHVDERSQTHASGRAKATGRGEKQEKESEKHKKENEEASKWKK